MGSRSSRFLNKTELRKKNNFIYLMLIVKKYFKDESRMLLLKEYNLKLSF